MRDLLVLLLISRVFRLTSSLDISITDIECDQDLYIYIGSLELDCNGSSQCTFGSYVDASGYLTYTNNLDTSGLGGDEDGNIFLSAKMITLMAKYELMNFYQLPICFDDAQEQYESEQGGDNDEQSANYDEQASDEQASDEQASDEQASDEQASDEQASDEAFDSDEQAGDSDEQAGDSDEQAGDSDELAGDSDELAGDSDELAGDNDEQSASYDEQASDYDEQVGDNDEQASDYDEQASDNDQQAVDGNEDANDGGGRALEDACPANGDYAFSVRYKLPESSENDWFDWLATGWSGRAEFSLYAKSYENGGSNFPIGQCTISFGTHVTTSDSRKKSIFRAPSAAASAGIFLGTAFASVLACLYCYCCIKKRKKRKFETDEGDDITSSFRRMQTYDIEKVNVDGKLF